MEEHVANGILTAKSHWRDYCIKVLIFFPLVGSVKKSLYCFLIDFLHDFQIKDAPAYLAVYSNTTGSTAKDLFDDVVEDLDKQVISN